MLNIAPLFMLRQSHSVFCYQRHSVAAFRLCFNFSHSHPFFAMFRYFSNSAKVFLFSESFSSGKFWLSGKLMKVKIVLKL